MNTLLRLKGLCGNKHKICNNVLRKCYSIKGNITKGDMEELIDDNIFYEKEEGKKRKFRKLLCYKRYEEWKNRLCI